MRGQMKRPQPPDQASGAAAVAIAAAPALESTVPEKRGSKNDPTGSNNDPNGQPQTALDVLLTSRIRARLLSLFVMNPETDYYLKGLVRDLHETNNPVRTELNRLEGLGILASRREHNVKYYRINRACPIYAELKGLVFKTSGLATLLKDRLGELGQIDEAFIYGSFASGQEGARSDIDLMIVGDVELSTVRRRLREIEAEVNREINETVYSPEEFAARRDETDAFLQRVLAAPRIILIGADNGSSG